ncbi:MAG: bacterial Ig-like domain-containing protein [Oscillospiraceae bacterium]|nr:bacterial Ig-like domain-containing protein [Oscillospiraceae bacterium]
MKKFARFLSVLLCVVMVFSLMPWGAVSAAEYGAPARRAPNHPSGMPTRERAIQSMGNEHYFTTFEDLQTLAAKSYSDTAYAVYAGEGMLTITKNLALPELLVLVVPGSLVINSGVEFSATYLFVDSLAVNGTLTTGYAEVYTYFSVVGTYYNYYQLHLWEDSFRSGESNVVHIDGGYGLIWYYPETMADLKAAAADAAANTSDSWLYSIVLPAMTITEDITLPWNCDVYIAGVDVYVDPGVTLTMGGYLWLEGGLGVNGALIVEGLVDIYYDNGGILAFDANASCSGDGSIYVTSSYLSDPFDATPGLTGYTSSYDSDYECWVLVPAEDVPDVPDVPELPQLGTPTDLGWGYDYSTGQTLPGAISWKNGLPSTGEFEIQVFCDGAPYAEYYCPACPETEVQWHSLNNFSTDNPATGEYYFTVTAVDSCGNYAPSPAAMSEKWYYVKPDSQLGTCTNLTMEGTKLSWDLPEDISYLGGYEVVLLYAATADEIPFFAGYKTVYADAENCGGTTFDITEEGYYSFEVRLLSSDINQVCNGQTVALGELVYFGENSGSGDNETGEDDFDDGNTGDDVQLPFDAYEWEVLKIANQERLAEGLDPLTMYDLIQQATDIRAVEVDEYFSHTRPDGTSCFTVFDEVGIRWGAVGENIAAGQQTPAQVMNSWMNSPGHRANILNAGFAHMGVGFYMGNSVYGTSWVQLFTDGGNYTSIEVMTEDGYSVEPGTTIDGMDLVAVLNSSVYGTCYLPVAEAYCSGYDPDQTGTQTVTVSVLGVSTTFDVTVGAAEPERLSGDFDNNGVVDDADVAYLLWHTLFADNYPIDIPGDLNGDDAVDDADVAYLLWHTLFPDAYPL